MGATGRRDAYRTQFALIIRADLAILHFGLFSVIHYFVLHDLEFHTRNRPYLIRADDDGYSNTDKEDSNNGEADDDVVGGEERLPVLESLLVEVIV